MGEHCEDCGNFLENCRCDDLTKLRRRVKNLLASEECLRGAIEGWRTANEALARENRILRDVLTKTDWMRRIANDLHAAATPIERCCPWYTEAFEKSNQYMAAGGSGNDSR